MRLNTKKNVFLSYLAGRINFFEFKNKIKFVKDNEVRHLFEKNNGHPLTVFRAFKEHANFDCFYMSQSFRDSIGHTYKKIWDKDFKKTYIFKKTSKIVITKDWTVIYQIFKEGSFLDCGLSAIRLTNDNILSDVSMVADDGWTVKTASHNADKEYREGFAYWPLWVEAFLDFAPKKTKILKPKEKIKKFHCRYFNELPFNVGLLDLNFYTQSTQSDPFMVRGHWRMQAYGKGMKDRKLKWIDTFWKQGYTKGAYMEK